eukprot:GFUD01008486.1.p1 GENE.GFUD01008486.1~~GFUD01008486.1.p1  ORF type:complete len:377 (+),score=101.44 GFUD01008486.1:169-1299(+)
MTSVLDRLREGEIIVGDGSYVFTLEKRGYVKAGKFTPESACEHPGAVKQLAIEFARAGADVTQTFTYGSTEGMLEGCAYTSEQINQAACDIAWEVARDKKTLVAGGITQTKSYTYQDVKDKKLVQKEIVQNAEILIRNKVDFIILEYFRNVEEIIWAIECLKGCGKPMFASLCIGPRGDSAGVDPGECAVRMVRAGAHVVGANCLFDPFINLTVLKMMKERLDKEGLSTFLMSQPNGFRSPDGGRYGYCDLPEFPYALEPRMLTRWEVRRWARAAYEVGVRYIGGCCGFEPYHIRAIAEELAPERGRLPEGSDKSDHDLSDMRKISESYSGKQDVETQYGLDKCCKEFWLNMEPATGRPKSAAMSTVHDPEIKMDG